MIRRYEKIRVVGKGAFGNAVLYRRRSDGLMVIIKEINMLELSASDRQMALNEVQVKELKEIFLPTNRHCGRGLGVGQVGPPQHRRLLRQL